MLHEYNIFILGAGFSVPGGLPLADKLWEMILKESKEMLIRNSVTYTLYDNLLKASIDSFMDYFNNSKKTNQISCESEINIEDFISYLDIEDYLRLLGAKHWSDAGNESQIMIRNFIAKIIYNKQKEMSDKEKTLYDEFVKKLKPHDLVITFNYDTILEDALERNSIPYRLYWEKSEKREDDSSNSEIIVHKMHGSIDWISEKYFTSKSKMCIWNRKRDLFSPKKIIPETFFPSNPLQHIYRIKNLGEYLLFNQPVLESPFIISPSFNKMVYLNPLKEFWRGFIGNGWASKRLVIIGFSLPPHDDYIRQPLYYVVKNFEESAFERGAKTSVIDFHKNHSKQINFRDNYFFLNEKITDFYFEGFSLDVLEKIFS